MVKEAMGKKGKTMKGLDEILKVPGAGEKCCKILVEGEYVICIHVNYISKINYGKTIDMFFFKLQLGQEWARAAPWHT